MATCSYGDSFYLVSEFGTSLDGCYEDSGSTQEFLTEYYRDGVKVDGEYSVHASTSFGTTSAIWVLSQYQDYGVAGLGSFEIRCKDADESDASLIHPTEVIQWDCEEADNEFTRLDYVTTTCGCTLSSGGSTDDGLSTGEIAGVVAGAIVAILGIIIVAYFGTEYVCRIKWKCDYRCKVCCMCNSSVSGAS